jgi:hypothetical protein
MYGDGGVDTAVGTGYTTFGIVPGVDISGAATVGSTESAGSYFSGLGFVHYYLVVTQVAPPPKNVTGIPVDMTYQSDGYVDGYGGRSAQATFDGLSYSAAGTYVLWFTPSVVYPASIFGSCYGMTVPFWSIYYAECQEVADPRFCPASAENGEFSR